MTQPRRILVVDDEPFIRELVQETLASLDYAVELAGDGPAALAAAAARPPDLVLLDVRLGGELDGLEVCRRLNAGPKPPIVIFLTGLASAEDADAAREAGAQGYLTKPFSPLELLERVERALGS